MTVTGENPGQEPGTSGIPTGGEPTQTTQPQPTSAPVTSSSTTSPPLPTEMPDMENDEAWNDLPKWVRTLRSENADRRVENRRLSEENEGYKRAQMSELDNLKLDVENFQKEISSRDSEIRQLQVQITASNAGVVDTDAVVRLLDWSKVDSGQSINDAISDLLEAKPYLKAQTTPPPTTPPMPTSPPSTTASGSPGNGDNNSLPVFTREQIGAMSPDEYNKNREGIMNALQNNRIR